VVERSTLDPTSSVLRRDVHDEHVLESLLVCAATVGPSGVEVREAMPATPGAWDDGLVEGLRSGIRSSPVGAPGHSSTVGEAGRSVAPAAQ
jgi:hypothetical protein